MFLLRFWIILLAYVGLLNVGCLEYISVEKARGSRDAEKTPPQDPKPFSAIPRPVLPTEDAPVYATDLHLNAGCMGNPDEFAVIAKHDPPSLCEHIVATPAQNADGDFFEVAAAISWTIEDTTVISLECENGSDDNSCTVRGLSDIFDAGNNEEPCTLLTACALNECPTPAPPDCAAMVCRSVTVCSVVNIEGTWSLDWSSFQEGSLASFAQYGRWFEDGAFPLDEGFILGDSISFPWGEYTFSGMLDKDRSTIKGEVQNILTDSPAGPWKAVRAEN
jgi:hypothetical protein